MRFMNECEIDHQASLNRSNPVLLKASSTLARFKDLVNSVSDGWCYWRKPVVAARKLMDLVEEVDSPTEENLKKALTPIKSFCTKQKLTFPMEGGNK